MEELLERVAATMSAMERMMERWDERELTLSAAAEERVGQIVAMVEGQRELELAERLRAAEAKLAEAENRIAELAASAAAATGEARQAAGRRTAAAGAVATLAKQGISATALEGLENGRMEAGSLDAALGSLSIEQRFAVKAEMLRNGLLG